ncbi:GTP cyclohydrolase, FolE2/MptA family, partial [Mesotoga sp. HF07.pep.5.2.highcov]
MRDVQNEKDKRNIKINMVGIKSIEYPIVVLDRKFGTQNTVG